MVIIYWHNMVEGMETFCEKSFKELSRLLSRNYLALPTLQFEQLSNEDAADLNVYLCLPVHESGSFSKLQNKRIIVYCNRDADFVVKVRQENLMARFGAAVVGLYSMVWTPDKYVLWHETLHLLDVLDSYDESGRTTCEEKNCIMQWNPNQENCDNTLILCKGALNMASAALNGPY